jgi:hypothetical protein
MIGAQQSSIGSKEWWCFLHFGKDSDQIQPITAEINRLSYLSLSIRDIRQLSLTQGWETARQAINHDITMNMRPDLCQRSSESPNAWMRRLECALEEIMRPVLVKQHFEQQDIAV